MLNLVPASDTQEKILMHGYKFVQRRELILVKKNSEINVEGIVMELLTERYIGICNENKMCFINYRNVCKEEALKEILKGEKKNVIKNRKNKTNR